MLKNWKQVLLAAEVGPADRILFAFSFGPFLGFWTAFEAAVQMGCLCLPGGGLSSVARLRMILDHGATVLCCTPTYAIRLGQTALENKIALDRSKVRAIIVAGEPGGSIQATRQLIESLWPAARVRDHHGMTEVGPVTHECPDRPCTLRVMEHSYLTEVLDPQTFKPVAPGHSGELVLTTLDRLGSPLLRYRTGDLVKPVYLNESGDGDGPLLSLEGGILGRCDDMVVVRGVNVYPSAVEQIVRGDPRIAEYRVEIERNHSTTGTAVTIAPTADHAADGLLTDSVAQALRSALSLRVPVKLTPCGSLPRDEMKSKRWVRKNSE